MSGSSGTLIPFEPTAASAFQFAAVFDAQNYVCTVTWNLWAQRWYLNIFTQQGALVACRALIASPTGYPINMVYALFETSTLVFWDSTQSFLITP